MNHLFPEEHSQLRLAIYHDSAVLCTTTPAGEHHKKKADVPTLPPPAFETASTQQVPLKLHLRPPPSRLTFRATHARPLQPAALAFVSYGFVLVRVRVRGRAAGLGRRAAGLRARNLGGVHLREHRLWGHPRRQRLHPDRGAVVVAIVAGLHRLLFLLLSLGTRRRHFTRGDYGGQGRHAGAVAGGPGAPHEPLPAPPPDCDSVPTRHDAQNRLRGGQAGAS
jgi:hypothetical protein